MRMLMRRWRIWTAWVVAAIGLYAVIGFFVVPKIARAQIVKQARGMLHREAKVTRVRFNPFTLAAKVEGLDLKDRDGADLFHLDRLSADFQVVGVFRRAFRFREIVLEGPQAVARIGADGRLSIADLFEAGAAKEPAAPKSSLPRVLVDRFAVKGGAAKFVDESRSPRFVEAFSPLDLELHELTTIPSEIGDHSITLGLAGGARIRWSGRQTVEPFRLEGKVEIADIRLPRLWNYLAAENPLELRDGRTDMSCSYEIQRRVDGGLQLAIKDADVTVREFAMTPRSGGEDWLSAPLVEIRGAQVLWPESRAEVREIRVKGPRALAWLDKDGTVNWQAAIPPRGAAAQEESKPWTARVGIIEISDGSARVEDRSFQPTVAVDVTDAGLKLWNVTSDLKAPIPASLSARINGGGEVTASGTVFADPPATDLTIKLRALDLKPFNPYAIHLPWADIRSGTAGAEGKLHVGTGSPAIRFDGALDVQSLQLAGAGLDRIVSCDRASADGARITIFPETIHIAKLATEGAFVNLDIDQEGNVNLKKIFVAKHEAATPPLRSEPLDLDIRAVAIKNATAEFTDESLILPFGTKIHSINGSIKDLSTTAAAAARLSLEGRISDAGYFKSDGALRIGAPFASTDVSVIFRGVSMPELTPYAAQFAGYSIKSGSLDVDVRYRIQDGRLVGDHRVVAKDLTLGPKVEGAKGPGVPVRLAIALLKDKDGRIDLEVPIEGTVNSPEFNYKSVFWQAFKTILGNVAKAPFVAIGRLFGADSEDLELVGFASGHSDLPAPEQEKLARLGVELAAKSEISLEIEGRFDPVTDADAIRRDRLEQRIEARRAGAANLEAILEALYAETFSPERLEAERQRFQPGDAGGFFDSLRSQLLDAEDVAQNDLGDLARARAAAIQSSLTAPGGLDASRVKLVEPAPVKRKKRGSELVASEMTLSAGD